MKRLAFFIGLLLTFSACNNNQEVDNVVYPIPGHPAYHNQLVHPYTIAIESDKEDPELFAKRAMALVNINCDSLGIIDLKRAVALDPEKVDYQIMLGEWLNKNELPHQAINYFDAVIAADPQFPAFLGKLKSLLLMKDYSAALEVLKLLRQNAQEHPDVKFLENEYLLAVEKDTTNVISQMKQYLQQYPGAFNILLQQAETEMLVNDANTVNSYMEVFKNDTLDAYPYERIGDYYRMNSQYDKAMMYYKKSVRTDLNYYYGFYKIGQLYEELDSLDKAISNYALAKDINPAFAPAYKGMALLFKKQGYQDSFNVYSQIAKRLDPKITFE